MESCGKQPETRSPATFTHQVVVAVTVVVFIVVFLWFLWCAAHVMLLLFLGILMAVFLRSLGTLFGRRTHLPVKWSLVIVLFAIAAFLTLSVYALVPRVSSQVEILSQELPRAMGQIKSTIEGYRWGKKLLKQIPNTEQLMNFKNQILTRTLGIFATTIGAVASIAILLFVCLYLAFDPATYIRGIIRLIPKDRRKRAEEVLHALGLTLARWLIGRFCGMAFVGVLVAVGLWLMGIHLALTLSIIAGLMDFIPNIGPVVAMIPVVLLVLVQSPAKVLYVILLYVAVQSADGYVLTPLIQQREISLPPVLILISQILMGLFFGVLGLVIATPLVACIVVLVRMLYVENILGDSMVS